MVAVAFIFGLAIGSFLNVCIYRIPRNISVVYPPSSCPVCDKRINWYDNIPLLSYLLLKGKCRNCGARISPVYPTVEALTGFYTALVVYVFGLSMDTAFYLVFGYMLIVASFIDLFHYIIPDRISLGLIVVGILFGILSHTFVKSLLGFLFGFALLYIIAIVGKAIFKKEAMGGGDIKLMGGIGSFLGIKGVLFTLFSASLLGSIVGITLIAMGKSHLGSKLPFGPYMATSAILYIFIGEHLLRLIYGF